MSKKLQVAVFTIFIMVLCSSFMAMANNSLSPPIERAVNLVNGATNTISVNCTIENGNGSQLVAEAVKNEAVVSTDEVIRLSRQSGNMSVGEESCQWYGVNFATENISVANQEGTHFRPTPHWV